MIHLARRRLDHRCWCRSRRCRRFAKFGFQLVIVATVQNATTIQPYIDSVVMVSKTEPTGRNARPVASVATRTISEFTSLRQEMRKTAERFTAGV